MQHILVNEDFVLAISVAESASCLDHFVMHVDSIKAHNDYMNVDTGRYPLVKPMA